MDGVDPDSVASQAQEEIEANRAHARTVLEWLLDDEHIEKMYPREELIQALSEDTGLSREAAADGIRGTVGDIVDPVQQITAGGTKYVGVIDYHTYPETGAYGYVDSNDVIGQRKRVVCARCVEKHDRDHQIAHATEGDGSIPMDAGWEPLVGRVEQHYADEHDVRPESIEPGATLLNGTTIAGNTAFHSGNDGIGSGLDAATLAGKGPGAIGGVTRLPLRQVLQSDYIEYSVFGKRADLRDTVFDTFIDGTYVSENLANVATSATPGDGFASATHDFAALGSGVFSVFATDPPSDAQVTITGKPNNRTITGTGGQSVTIGGDSVVTGNIELTDFQTGVVSEQELGSATNTTLSTNDPVFDTADRISARFYYTGNYSGEASATLQVNGETKDSRSGSIGPNTIFTLEWDPSTRQQINSITVSSDRDIQYVNSERDYPVVKDISVGSNSTTIDTDVTTSGEIQLDPAATAISTGPDVSYSIDFTEDVDAVDPSVTIDGQTATFSGTVVDGDQVDVSGQLDFSSIGEGVVDISLGNSNSGTPPQLSVGLPESLQSQHVEAPTKNIGFEPSTAVIVDTARGDGSAVEYQLFDDEGNRKRVPRGEIPGTVDLSGFTGTSVGVRALLAPGGEVEEYAVYFQ